nr:MAG TPA: hypothetical protein [Caudoviricetes sp.]
MVYRRTKTSITAWSVIRNYFAKCSYGSLVMQKTIRAILESKVENYRKYGSIATVNSYFNFLAGAGYIRHTKQPGIWVVVKPVSKNLTSSKLKEEFANRKYKRGYAYGGLQDRAYTRQLF